MLDFIFALLIVFIPIPNINLSGHTCGPAAANAEVCEQVKEHMAEDWRSYIDRKPYVLDRER